MKRWSGATIEITSTGTPKKAAGRRKNVKSLKKTDMLCLNAQAKLNSSLL
jgi:hypothetical protein